MSTTTDLATECVNGQKLSEKPLDQELEFLWQDCDRFGKTYDLCLGRISRNPVVRSHATGQYFMLPWSHIIHLAIEQGVNEKPGQEVVPAGK